MVADSTAKIVEGILNPILANFDSIRFVLAVGLGAYLVFVLIQRFRSDEDPSIRYTSESAGGTMSILISGAHVVMALAAGIVVLTWPFVLRVPQVGLALIGASVVAYGLEKMETDMN